MEESQDKKVEETSVSEHSTPISNKKSFLGSSVIRIILFGSIGLLALVFLFRGKEEISVKGYDTSVIDAKIKEIEEQNIKRQQEIMKKLDELKTQKSEKETKLSPEEKDVINKIGDLILPSPKEEIKTSPKKNEAIQIPSQVMPERPKIVVKEISYLQNPAPVAENKGSLNPSQTIKEEKSRDVNQMMNQNSEKKDEKSKKTFFLPAGTIVEGKLYTGALAPVKNAPSVFESPLVVIGFTRNGITPGFRSFPLKGGVVIGKAEGIWNLKRVVIKAYKIVLVTRDGRVIEKQINGQVQGEDGIDGVPGYLVNPDEAVRMLTFLGGTAASGFFAALAEAQKETTTTALGTTTRIKDELKYGIAMSVSKSWDEFTKWYLEQLKVALPFVVAEPGKKVYFVVQDGVEINV